MTVVVTGASGHVGVNLVQSLVAAGRHVHVVIDESTLGLEGLPVEIVQRDPDAMRRALAGADVVFHLAAIISIDGDRGGKVPHVNVQGPKTVARAALSCGVRRMVHCSSIHAFEQEPLDQPLDETRARVLYGFGLIDPHQATSRSISAAWAHQPKSVCSEISEGFARRCRLRATSASSSWSMLEMSWFATASRISGQSLSLG